jgi:uncharacterized membrane protein
METLIHNIETGIRFVGVLFDIVGVVTIVIGFIFATIQFVANVRSRGGDSMRTFRLAIGRTLLLALEILVAADIIRTVAVELTLENLLTLGLLVVIRTFLSWSLELEIDGRFPWQRLITSEDA